MAVTLRTRKPVVQLSPADFDAFPIWEYALDEEGEEGQDETWVRPVDRTTVPLKAYSQLVAASFTSVANHSFVGFMDVTTARKPIEIDPGAIVRAELYATIPRLTRAEAEANKAPWVIRERDELLRVLGLAEKSLFPIRYELRVLIGKEKERRNGLLR